MSKHSYCRHSGKASNLLWRKNCDVRGSVWKALRRIWIESVTVSKIAWKIYIYKKDPIWKKTSIFTGCRIAQRCNIVSKWKHSGHRYSINKIQFIFIKRSDVVAWVVFVTVNTGAFIIFTSWIWGFTVSFTGKIFALSPEKVGHLFTFSSPRWALL